MFESNNNSDTTTIVLYVLAIIVIMLFIWYVSPNLLTGKENYAPDRERTDPQSDWNIVEAIKSIRNIQSKFFSRRTQSPNYGY